MEQVSHPAVEADKEEAVSAVTEYPDWMKAAELAAPKVKLLSSGLSNLPTGQEDPGNIHYTTCPRCQGLGVDPDSNGGEADCYKCEGTGEVPCD